jgi:hypothetical protein
LFSSKGREVPGVLPTTNPILKHLCRIFNQV